MTRVSATAVAAVAITAFTSYLRAAEPNTLTNEEKAQGFVLLFDGESMDGWKISENPASIKLVDGKIVVIGNRAHAFYVGELADKGFKNYEFRTKVYCHPKANSGVFFNAKVQEKGWPLAQGYEAQINNTHRDPIKTGSIYKKANVSESAAKDGEWFELGIVVKDGHIQTLVNGEVAAEYQDPADAPRLTGGTFALQCHDPGSKVEFHTIRVKMLD